MSAGSDGQVLTSDGFGATAWEDAGGVSSAFATALIHNSGTTTLTDSTLTDSS